MLVAVVPALDEEKCVGHVVSGLMPHARVVVVDNGSRDRPADAAAAAGAEVVHEPRRGYGRACLAGVARARELGATIVAFLDADGSDDPSELPCVVGPIERGEADLVLGVRTRGSIEPG